MSTKPDSQPPRVRIELLKPHRHAGRDYKTGQFLELPEGKAGWLVSVGTAKAAPAAPPRNSRRQEGVNMATQASKSTPIVWNGQGPVHIGIYDPINGRPEMGFLTNLYSVGCANRTLTVTPSRETGKIKESCSGQRMTLKEYETGKGLEVNLSMVQFDTRTMASAFFGEAMEIPGGTVTDEQLAKLEPGDYFFLRNPRSKSVVIEDSTPGTPLTYVLGTHYEEDDAEHGRYRLLAHPALHVEPLKVDYEYDSFVNVAAFSKTNVERGIIFSGVNGDGQKQRVIIPRIPLALDGSFNWLSDEPSDLALKGEAQYVPGLKNDPLFGPFMRIDAMV